MKGMNIVALAAAAMIAMSTSAAADTLATPMGGGNNQNGIMFNVVVGPTGVTFQSLGVNVQIGTSDFEFYTIAGGINGNQSNAGAWTLRDSFSSVTSAGIGNFTTFDIADFYVAAGSTIGFYITNTGSSGGNGNVQYTNGIAVGNVVASNGDLSILSGYGKSYPFASTFQPRNFNGSITYSTTSGVPEPATWAMVIGGFAMVGGAIRRRRVSTKVSFA